MEIVKVVKTETVVTVSFTLAEMKVLSDFLHESLIVAERQLVIFNGKGVIVNFMNLVNNLREAENGK